MRLQPLAGLALCFSDLCGRQSRGDNVPGRRGVLDPLGGSDFKPGDRLEPLLPHVLNIGGFGSRENESP